MKRILIVNVQAPFVWGGAEMLAEDLKKHLIEYGHKADIVRIPFKWYPSERIPEHILACRLFDLTEASGERVDQIIGLKFPAYFVKHPKKVLWMLHQHRAAYDLWGTKYQDIPSTPEGIAIRNIIMQADNSFLPECEKIYTNSKIVSKRLKDFNDIDSTPLYPPLEGAELFHCEEYDDYIFYPSRVNEIKRQALAIESMRYVKSNVRLIIAGKSDSDSYIEKLQGLIDKYDLASKVTLLGQISQEEKISLFSKALGTMYIPFNEDSYGYVTLEGFYSRKPVITCKDSGGVYEIVEDQVNGFIVDSEPQALADAIDSIGFNKKRATLLGQAGYEKLVSMDITWDNVMRSLIL
jgi:glycosyltransferase involved in cell wall biosynthesis